MKKIIQAILCVVTALAWSVPALAEAPTVKIISKPIYADGETGLLSEGIIWIRSNDSYKYLNEDGSIAIASLNPRKYFEKSTRIVSVGDFHGGLAVIAGNEYGEQAFIDKEGNKIFDISGTASLASPFSEGLSLAYDENSGDLFLYDKQGNATKYDMSKIFDRFDPKPETYNIVDPPVFHDGLITIQFFIPETDETLFGYFDKDQNEIIKPQQFDYALAFDDGVAFVQEAGKFGLINKEGNYLAEPQFDYVLIEDPYFNCTQFNEEMASVSKDSKFGFINREGKIIGDFIWDDARHFSSGYCAVVKDGKFGYVDYEGKTIIKPSFDDASYFVDGVALVGEDGTYRLINEKAESVSYEVWKFDETIVSIANPSFIKYKLDGKWGFAKIISGNDTPAADNSTSDKPATNAPATGESADNEPEMPEYSTDPQPVIPIEESDSETALSEASSNPTDPGSIKVIFKDEELKLNLPIININGRTMYPFRECLEAFGAKVSWHAPTKTATGTLDKSTISFIVGSDEYMVNGRKEKMENGASSFTDNGVTYIPIRYAAEGLGFTVRWDAETNSIFID